LGVLSTGSISDTAGIGINSSVSSAETTSTVQTVNLLGGIVTADLVKADAHGSYDGVTHHLNDSGSSFTNLKVNGQDMSNVAANTSVAISGVGTLWLHRVISTPKSVQVRMIELVVSNALNPFGLAVGTDIRVAFANVVFRD
jgi:hypothetical protein